MRIATIAVVFVVLIAATVLLTRKPSSEESSPMSKSSVEHGAEHPSSDVVLQNHPVEKSGHNDLAEQQEHAKQMAHGMAAQHARHENAKQGHQAEGGHAIHWSYKGPGAPSYWGSLAPEYAVCGSGKNQSPVDLQGFVDAELPKIDFNYSGMALDILNNGHTVQANYLPGTTLSIDGREFELKQFHFHSPSENLLNGQSFPLEAHLVHADKDGNLAVVSVLYQEGAANNALAKLWAQMPEAVGDKSIVAAQVKASELLPRDRGYYRFNGSLTTPPCSQGVIWLVMKEQPTVSRQQVDAFNKVMGSANNRPVQPLNARVVLE